jgi:hypothetical protein
MEWKVVGYARQEKNRSGICLATNGYSFAYHAQATSNNHIFISDNMVNNEDWAKRSLEQHLTLVDIVLWSTFTMLFNAAPFLFAGDGILVEAISQQKLTDSHPKGWSEVLIRAEDLTQSLALLMTTWLLRCNLPLPWLISSVSTQRGILRLYPAKQTWR